MKKAEKILSLVLAFAILFTAFSVTVTAEILESGTCGDNLTWTLDSEGTLTISGTGEMYSYWYDDTPWGIDIKNVVIENGITSIGDEAFYNCTSLESITIPDSVISIGKSAFYNCTNLTITGVKGSTAEKYANENGFAFVEIESEVILPEADSDEYIDTESMTMPNIVANTTASTIISKLSAYGITATVTDKDGNALTETDMIGTGCKVTDSEGNVYTVIVNGDIDGTGEVNATDYLQIKKMFLGTLNLENEYFTAADTDGDGEITSTDYLQIKRYFLGTLDLYA